MLSRLADVDSRGVEVGGRFAGRCGINLGQSVEHRRVNGLLPVCGRTNGTGGGLVESDRPLCLSRCDFLFPDLYRVVVLAVVDELFLAGVPAAVWMGSGGRVLFAVDEGDGDFCDGSDGVSLVSEEGAVSVRLGAG